MCLATNSKKDPTNTSKIRARAIKELKRRKKLVERDLVAFIESLAPYVQRQVIEDGRVVNRVVYKYELDPSIDTDATIRAIIDKWFGTGAQKPSRYFFDDFITAAYTQGAAIETSRIGMLAGRLEDMSRQQVEMMLSLPAYQQRISKLASRAFESMVDFSGDAGAPLRYYLAEAMASGKGIKTMTAEMRQLWTTQADYRLERIARTETAHAHREARHDADLDARDRLGLAVKAQWISQLSPTTRPSHAEQHLKIFELEEVAEVYAEIEGGEINCLCLQQSVVITQDGEVLGERKETPADKSAVAFIMTKG